ncbi:tetraspanin-18-like [Ostrinia furnacalis]|uniref:tetraspanin-18-like n=1 Tax=Ostrinia furnacalis TaxID=93504 RepID=UPI00103DD071|nr:tetraspanin-18-like [Ostrinia furnacalis]
MRCANSERAAIVLLIVAAIQAVVLGTAVKVTDADEVHLAKDLEQSFRLARENNPTHAALWAATQHELNCCGVNGPGDYRSSNLPDYFPPNIPIACCPKYDPDRSELVQEREREFCKAKKTYYDIGCKEQVLEGFRASAKLVLAITVSLIVFEVLLAITSSILYKKVKKYKSRRSGDGDPHSKP